MILVDYFTLARIPAECFEHAKVMVVDKGLDKETIASLFITGNIKGIVDAHADIKVLCKAIRVVHEGQLWIDQCDDQNAPQSEHIKKSGQRQQTD